MKLEPVLKEKVWGGRALSRLGKTLPGGRQVGESWEASDLEGGTTRVLNGDLKGWGLGQVLDRFPREVYGPGSMGYFSEGFPLLLKFLDARQWLSVQVHPTAEYLQREGLLKGTKSEAWHIVASEGPGELILGLKEPLGLDELRCAIENERLEEVVNRVRVEPGDTVFIPSGTLHAIGPGLVIFEIQEPSDITFRLYDWGRRSRELHLDVGLQVVRRVPPPVEVLRPIPLAGFPYLRELLVRTLSFSLEKLHIDEPAEENGLEFHLLTVLEGTGGLRTPTGDRLPLGRGETVLVPAAIARYTLEPEEGRWVLLRSSA
jgi:mannose-6-phosphate isomerase